MSHLAVSDTADARTCVTADDNSNRFARDIKILTEWFTGEFDNEEQRWFEHDPRAKVREDRREMRIRTQGAPRSPVYTVHDVNSRRLGFHTQGIGAHCHREGYEFREALGEL